jgi:molybdopterin/thiamine biosynthesis adenylyltransferase
MQPWVDRYPERLAHELAEYERYGLAFQPDQRELVRNRRLIMHGQIDHGGQCIELTVAYPDSYPYTRAEVYAPGLQLGRHQNPYDSNLCLLDRSTREWDTTNTGAWLIIKRLPLLLELLQQGGRALREREAPQGEPITSYLATTTGAMLLVTEPGLQVPERIVTGTMRLGLGMAQPAPLALRAAVLSLNGQPEADGEPWRSEAVDSILAERFSAATLTVPWVRLQELPPTRESAALIAAAARVSEAAGQPRWFPAQGDTQIAPLGLLVPEEVGHGVIEHSWVLAVRVRPSGRLRQPPHSYLLRGERLTHSDLAARTPATVGIQENVVALAGTGAIGAPLALELARAQTGQLRLLDHDGVEVGNTVRWPYGLSAVGHPKANFLAQQIQLEYPLTHAIAYLQKLGAAPPQSHPRELSEAAVLTAFLDGVDLMIDATGELGISQLLADLAREQEIPLISAWGTEGGWGGAVAVINPQGGCWFCLQLHLAEHTIPAPPAEPTGRVQPRGCAAPTFTATSYDMLEVVAQSMRCVRRVLLEQPAESLVHVCATRTVDGTETPAPQWTTHALNTHSHCPCCHAASRAA